MLDILFPVTEGRRLVTAVSDCKPITFSGHLSISSLPHVLISMQHKPSSQADNDLVD